MIVEPRAPRAHTLSYHEVVGVLSGVLLGMLLAALDQSIVATALPAIARELQGLQQLSWIVAAYLLTSTASTPLYGKLSDLYGRRLLLQIAIGIFVVASILCGSAQTMPELIAARALQGLGGGGLISMAQAVIADVIAPRERGRYQGYFSGVWATASVAGPVLGGLFVDYVSWRWVFWINLPLGIAAFLLCRRSLARLVVLRRQRRIDYLGAALLTALVADLLLLASGASASSWPLSLTIALVVAAPLLLLAFTVQELRALEPILPPRLFANPIIAVANLVSFLAAMAMFGGIVLLPVFLQLVLGAGAGHSGVLLIPLMGGTVIGAFSAGQLMRRTGRYKAFPVIGLSMSTVAFGIMATMSAATPSWRAMVYMALLGIGTGSSMPVMLVAVQNAADARDIGIATATVAFFRSLGGSFGAALLWAVLLAAFTAAAARLGISGVDAAMLTGADGADATLATEPRLVAPLARAFHLVFVIGAVIAAASAVAAAFIKERPLRTTPAQGSASE